MTVRETYGLIDRAIAADAAANGYIVVGEVGGEAGRLADLVAARLMCRAPVPGEGGCGKCEECHRVADGVHPDVHRLRPESLSRVIKVESMRERMIDPMSMTAFAGGWKLGVVEYADRMNESAANAFLKLLEEPPPRTMFMLLTDSPESLLPTVVSRCQSVDVSGGRRLGLSDPWRGRVLGALAAEGLDGFIEKAAAAEALAAILAELKEKAEERVEEELARFDDGRSAGEEPDKDARKALVASYYRKWRADLVLTVLGWFRDLAAVKAGGAGVPLRNGEYRDVLAERAANLTLAQCLRNLEAVEEAASSLERNLSEGQVLPYLCDRLGFGCGGAR